MSKKDKLKKQNLINATKDNKTEKPEKEQLSRGEKIFTNVTLMVGLLAIIIIVLVSIPYGGEKERIARKFDTLSNDNVYTYIEYDEIRDKIAACETFQVLLINTSQDDADEIIYYIDEIVKDYEENKEIVLQPIYIFDTSKISKNKDQETYFKKNVGSNIFDAPNIIYYEKTIRDYSVDTYSSCRYELSDFSNNYWRLLLRYFDDAINKK